MAFATRMNLFSNAQGTLCRRTIHAVTLGICAVFLLISLQGGSAPALAAEGAAPQTPAVAEKKSMMDVSFAQGLLSVTATDADIRTLVETIAARSGVEIVLDKSITGKANVEFKDVKFEEGLKRVLKDVVEGGFASEYVKKNDEKGQLALSKVTIVRIGKGARDLKDMLYISDITVQDAIGKEVAFAKWGSGTGEIPLMINKINGIEYRGGFAMMRVGEDGSLYFVHWGHNKIYVYGKDVNLKNIISFSGRFSQFDVDHEGNIYLMDATDVGAGNTGLVIIFNQEGKQIGTVTIPRDQVRFSRSAVIDDGKLKDGTASGEIYDFRKYLKNQDGHASRKRYLGNMKAYDTPISENNRLIGNELIVWGVDSIGLPYKFIKSTFPQEWNPGDDGPAVLGIDGRNRIYCLVSIFTKTPERTKNNYAIALMDPAKETINYFRIKELDNFVYEKSSVRNNYKLFDVDHQGDVYHLFTSKEGVYVYEYSLGGAK